MHCVGAFQKGDLSLSEKLRSFTRRERGRICRAGCIFQGIKEDKFGRNSLDRIRCRYFSTNAGDIRLYRQNAGNRHLVVVLKKSGAFSEVEYIDPDSGDKRNAWLHSKKHMTLI